MQEQYKIIKNTLNLYAIFGYILPGFFLVFLLIFDNYLDSKNYNIFNIEITNIEFLNQSLYFIRDKSTEFPNFTWFIVLLFLFYILGHFVSAFSSLIFERYIVKYKLGYPSINLLDDDNSKKKLNCIFNNFQKSLHKSLIDKIKEDVKKLYFNNLKENNLENNIENNLENNLDEYYWICYTYIINHKPYLSERIHHFVNLYGFTRNIAGAILILVFKKLIYFIFALFIELFFGWNKFMTFVKSNLYILLVITLLSLTVLLMFWSYLKLFRRQALDVYLLFLTVFDEVDFIRTQSQNTNEKKLIND